jgi:hypothetical protein
VSSDGDRRDHGVWGRGGSEQNAESSGIGVDRRRRSLAPWHPPGSSLSHSLSKQNNQTKPNKKNSYSGFGAAFLITLMVAYGPDRTLQAWAKPVAERELAEEDAAFEKYSSDAAYKKSMDEKLAAHGRAPERFFDAVMMRREYAVLKAQHEASGGK